MSKIKTSGAGGITATIVVDSISESGQRLTTLQLKYPRLIHAEFMTHRVFSRNASSSRAIPVHKIIEQVENEPAMPIHWGANEPGMQASGQIPRDKIPTAKKLWSKAAKEAVNVATDMMALGLHKQVANRILEPFQFMHVVVTATEWDNFFKLRQHDAADPNIHELADVMKTTMNASIPKILNSRDYHLPYISDKERDERMYADLIKASVARCARVSYLNHDKSEPDFDKDVSLHDTLFEAGHMSPFEHIATPSTSEEVEWYGNFKNWIQWRQVLGE